MMFNNILFHKAHVQCKYGNVACKKGNLKNNWTLTSSWHTSFKLMLMVDICKCLLFISFGGVATELWNLHIQVPYDCYKSV